MICRGEFISVSILVKFLRDQFKNKPIQEASGFFSLDFRSFELRLQKLFASQDPEKTGNWDAP